jgi:L-iditol 2-dehydrogenase
VDLAKPRVGSSLAILGAGPIGLLILQVARLAGAEPVFVADRFPWRLERVARYGGVPVPAEPTELLPHITRETNGRGVDVAIEAAWADQSVEVAAELARLGGRVVLVGIPGDDRLVMKHSTARRKGLTVMLSRRMKHVYPRAIRLALRGSVDLDGLVTHRFPLRDAVQAFHVNAAYEDQVVKVMVTS